MTRLGPIDGGVPARDLSDFPVTRRWPAQHPDRLQLYSFPTPNGRKVAIEILDFFDRLGVTLRRGDLRRINPHRIDMFVDQSNSSKSA